MTPRQQQCLDTITSMIAEGVSPTYQAIADRMGYANKSRAFYVVKSLVERGLLVRSDGRWNSFAIPTRDAEGIPFDRMAEAICGLKASERSFYAVRNVLAKAFAEGATA